MTIAEITKNDPFHRKKFDNPLSGNRVTVSYTQAFFSIFIYFFNIKKAFIDFCIETEITCTYKTLMINL